MTNVNLSFRGCTVIIVSPCAPVKPAHCSDTCDFPHECSWGEPHGTSAGMSVRIVLLRRQDNGRRLDCFLTKKVSRFNSLACDLIRRLPHRAVMLDSR
jgi:hypothetical protein